ncbi:MAG: hypothetical protein LBF41_04525 [Deltaproteobacteria bacterium]|nr:hypothetical protein [Deltaproteobacteria bacterium]
MEPGVYPVYRLAGDNGREHWGHILRREGRNPTWLCLKDPNGDLSDDPLCLCFDLPDHRLLSDGSLFPASGETASVHLVCELGRIRNWSEKSMFVLRFKSLVRLL